RLLGERARGHGLHLSGAPQGGGPPGGRARREPAVPGASPAPLPGADRLGGPGARRHRRRLGALFAGLGALGVAAGPDLAGVVMGLLVDIRYHLASLIGVFLALGVGMLIGTQLAQGGALENEQQRLAQRLEARLEGLRAENRALLEAAAALEERLARERDFADLVLGAVVSGTLAGVPVDVYVPPGHGAAAQRLQRVLAQAGAR